MRPFPNSLLTVASAVLSTQWRLNIYQECSGVDYPLITDVEMRPAIGGTNIATGGTASASSSNPSPSRPASYAFDGNSANSWQAGDFCPAWLQYTFPSPVTINEVAISVNGAGGLYAGGPSWFDLQYYNGSSWVTYFTGFAGGWPAAGQCTRVFNSTTGTLGSELLPDPGFDIPGDWSASGGWSVSGSQAVASSASSRLVASGVLTAGKSYAVNLPYTKTAGSKLRITTVKSMVFLSPALANTTAVLYPTFFADDVDLRLEADTAVITATFPSISLKEFTENLGPERVTDPGFDNPSAWSATGGWSISGSNAVGSSAGDRLSQTGVFVSGKVYRVLFQYTMTTGAKLRIRTEANNNIYLTPTLSTVGGLVCAYVIADGTELRIEADTNFFTGTIPSISVKEVL